MKLSSTSIFLLASNVIAAPTLDVKRSIPGPVRFIDTAIQVENLQVALLTQGLKAFTEAQFQKAGFSGKNFYRNLKEIVVDSRNHIATAAKVEQVEYDNEYTALAPCNYSFPITDVKSFMQLAATIKGVAVGFYAGSAPLFVDKTGHKYGSGILATQARHSAFLNDAISISPFAASFDVPLDANAAFTIFSKYIVSCPAETPRSYLVNPSITTVGKIDSNVAQGSTVSFTVAKDYIVPSGNLYIGWPTYSGPLFSDATFKNSTRTLTAKVPKNASLAGRSYAYLTQSTGTEFGNYANLIAGPAIVPILPPYLA